MSIDEMKQALAALEQYTNVVTSVNDPNSWVSVSDGGKPARDAITALRAAIEQAQTAPAKGGLAEKVPATGTHLETIVRKAFDQIYAEQDLERWADQEPVAWVNPKWLNPKTRHWTNDTILHKPIAGWVPLYTAPRQWQGLTDERIESVRHMRDVQGYDGNWNYDPYMQGLYNGLEFALSLLEVRQPEFKDAPAIWLGDIKFKRDKLSSGTAHDIEGEKL